MERIIAEDNEWWETGRVPRKFLGTYKRTVLPELIKELENKKVTSLIGPRRTGKTTLLYQVIDHLIEKGISPKRIIYLNFDSPELRLKSGHNIRNCIELFEKRILKETVTKAKKQVYIFLDEIQKLENWGDQIKALFDLKISAKFFIAGSSSLRILQGSGESLLGRITHKILLPLSFREILKIKKDNINIETFDVCKKSFSELEKLYSKFFTRLSEIGILFEDYIIKGGYPEAQDMELPELYRALDGYKTLTIKKDILDIMEVRDTASIDELLLLFSAQFTQLASYGKLSNALGIRIESVKRYVSLLESAFFIKLSYLWAGSFTSVKKRRKVFFIDNGMRNAITKEKDFGETEMGKLAENLVFTGILRRQFRESIDPKMFYWRDKSGNEVDFVWTVKGDLLPVEVKFQKNIQKRDMKGILSFMEKFNISKGFVITRNLFERRKTGGREIIFIPAWFFLVGL